MLGNLDNWYLDVACLQRGVIVLMWIYWCVCADLLVHFQFWFYAYPVSCSYRRFGVRNKRRKSKVCPVCKSLSPILHSRFRRGLQYFPLFAYPERIRFSATPKVAVLEAKPCRCRIEWRPWWQGIWWLYERCSISHTITWETISGFQRRTLLRIEPPLNCFTVIYSNIKTNFAQTIQQSGRFVQLKS